MKKSWHLDRRTFLRGAGASLGLPLLECMGADKVTAVPRRFCSVYFPYGASLPRPGAEGSNWRWFPNGDGGRDFQFNESLKPLEALREEITIIEGLSHPRGRKMGGHDTADIFLTGAELKPGELKNTVSADQVAADAFGEATRYRSLVMSTDGGVGEPTRSSTLSFGRTGQPVPALNKPRVIFNRFFGANSDDLNHQRKELARSSSMLDLVYEHSKSVRGKLGKQDQEKFDEYLDSVRSIEQRVERSESWLDVPKPEVDPTGLFLDADENTPAEYVSTMYDLMYLAFQTDSTRVATYQIGNMNGATSIAGKFPELLGLPKNMHGLAHGWNKKGGAEALGKWDLFLAQQLARFLEKMRSTSEGEGSLLDHTAILYGTSNSNTHNNNNCPMLTAGGKGMGLNNGQHLKLGADVPMSNLLLTLLQQVKVPVENFSDSTGAMSEILA